MKKVAFLVTMFLVLGSFTLASAKVPVPGSNSQVAYQQPAAYAESSVYQQPAAYYKPEEDSAKEIRALKRELRNYKKAQKARVDSIDNRLKTNEENVGILFKAHNGLVRKFNWLRGFSIDNIKSINTKVSELSCELTSVKSFQELVWFVFRILFIAAVIVGVVSFLRRERRPAR